MLDVGDGREAKCERRSTKALIKSMTSNEELGAVVGSKPTRLLLHEEWVSVIAELAKLQDAPHLK